MASGIFISYRRDDTRQAAGRLAGDLEDRFGSASIFRDIEGIELGVDFDQALNKALTGCQVMLVLIGQRWSSIEGKDGTRRLEQAEDWIRTEVATALQRDIRVVPVLVDGAGLPSAADLPDDLKPLLRKQAFKISDESWRTDVQRLVDGLARMPGIALANAQVGAQVGAQAGAQAGASAMPPVRQAGGNKVLYAGAGGLVVLLAVVGGLFLIPSASTDTSTDPGTNPITETAANVSGDWRTDDGLRSFNISQNDKALTVTLWRWNARKNDWVEGPSGTGSVSGRSVTFEIDHGKAPRGQQGLQSCALELGQPEANVLTGTCGPEATGTTLTKAAAAS